MPRLRVGGPAPPESYQRMSLDLGDVIAVQKILLDARRDFIAAGDQHSAGQVAVVFDKFVVRIRRAAERTAAYSEERIVAHIDASRVRPDTGRGQTKLRDVVFSEAWDPTSSVATGTVAIALKVNLSQVPYWHVQEEGYHYKHSPKGLFFGPGGSGQGARPTFAEFRMHPIFVTGVKGGRRFRKPPTIKPRHFLRDGADEAIAFWRAETDAAIAEATAQLRRLLARMGRGTRARRAGRRP